MPSTFHILNSGGKLNDISAQRIEQILKETSAICETLLTLADTDVVVMNAPSHVIPRIGVCGFAYDADQLIIWIDLDHDNMQNNFETALGATLAHELHHCARAHALGSSHGKTYGDTLVAEGLACCFEQEVTANVPFYAIECTGEALVSFSVKARNHVQSNMAGLPENPSDWIFGRQPSDPEFPYQCGYSLGYSIVNGWLDAYDLSASEAVDVETRTVIDWWLNSERPMPLD